jgi:hypothetical protein
MLPVAPRNFLNHDRLAAAAIDTPDRIEQKTRNPQKGMNSKRRSGSWS